VIEGGCGDGFLTAAWAAWLNWISWFAGKCRGRWWETEHGLVVNGGGLPWWWLLCRKGTGSDGIDDCCDLWICRLVMLLLIVCEIEKCWWLRIWLQAEKGRLIDGDGRGIGRGAAGLDLWWHWIVVCRLR
jgi:hypothetical protein